ncbi:MAG TPA: hypothetical protein VFP35_02100 [Candidatus Saccharimonadales bacterium]|nr:hypothetical protein [Candidatus Saccharimonadales bacterium]
MAIFYRCTNNGTTAVVPENVYEQIQAQHDWWMRVQRETGGREPIESPEYPKPIFTFVRREHLGPDLHLRNYVTASLELMDTLLQGHVVFSGEFYVPFSNSIELNDHDPRAEGERTFRTTLEQAIKAFELVRAGTTQ